MRLQYVSPYVYISKHKTLLFVYHIYIIAPLFKKSTILVLIFLAYLTEAFLYLCCSSSTFSVLVIPKQSAIGAILRTFSNAVVILKPNTAIICLVLRCSYSHSTLCCSRAQQSRTHCCSIVYVLLPKLFSIIPLNT